MKAVIISVGGTPEPIIKSLINHKPDFVCFFASQQTIDNLGEIKNRLKKEDIHFKDYKVICEDAEDLVHCYEEALLCSKKLKEHGINPEKVVVDYTAGTKTMTAALALATVGHGYGFSYVGGKRRTKNGQGVVISGTEVVKKGISPWQLFAVEEKKRISLFVSSFQYEAAIAAMQNTVNNLKPGDQKIWEGISEILKGFLAWDNFDHPKAVVFLSNGKKLLGTCQKFGLEKPVETFFAKVNETFDELDEINKKTCFFKKMHPVLILDLVSNARRRYLQNRYDDAMARLYRALEMVGQIDFEKYIGCSTSDVDAEKLPEKIRKEFKQRYCSPDDGKIRLPLFATFRVLNTIDRPSGRTFFENEDIFKDILTARNYSILAHGTRAVKKETYEKFSKIIQELFVKKPLIRFPELKW